MKRKRIIIPIFLIGTLFLFTGCEQLLTDILTDVLKTNINVAEIEFETDEIALTPAPEGSPSEDFRSFEEIQIIRLADMGDGGRELNKYNKEHIKDLTCEWAALTVFSPKHYAGHIVNFTATVLDNPALSYRIDTYNLGELHSNQEVKAFVEKAMYELLKSKDSELSILLSGETDLPEGEKLKMHVEIKGIRAKIQAL